jgi:hypothetical protein
MGARIRWFGVLLTFLGIIVSFGGARATTTTETEIASGKIDYPDPSLTEGPDKRRCNSC